MVTDAIYTDIRNPSFWKQKLGLLPIHLFSGDQVDKYVMLNGSSGNFCLDTVADVDHAHARSLAWSSNVGHYLSVTERDIEVKTWDVGPSKFERFPIKKIAIDLEQFHAHLESRDPRTGTSVVSHAIRTFRKLRATLGNEFDGVQSLKAFLALLADARQEGATNQLNIQKWNLPADALQVRNSLKSGDWSALLEELIFGRSIDELKTEMEVLLRHALGEIFQEAHFEATHVSQDQLAFEGFLPKTTHIKFHSKIKGVHFTPPSLARTLAEESLAMFPDKNIPRVIFDPACGSGEFLKEAVRQIRAEGYSGQLTLIGWDISEAACDMARFALSYELGDAPGQIKVLIQQKDSLQETEWPQDVDLVLMNPPFVSWEELDKDERARLTQVLGPSSSGRPDLSYGFLMRAISSLSRNGILASIIPASFLDSDSAKSVRKEIGINLAPRLVARLGSHTLFSKTLVDTGMFIAKNGERVSAVTAVWADHRSSSTSAALRTLRKRRVLNTDGPVSQKEFSIYSVDLNNKGMNWAPRPYQSWKLALSFGDLPPVDNFFAVRQGARTGGKKAFILERNQFDLLPPSEKNYFRPAVINQSIVNGYLRDAAYVFYPYGRLKIESEAVLKQKLPVYFAEYLKPAKSSLLARSRIKANKWWVHQEPRAWQLEKKQKLVSTYFGGAGSFAWDSTGEFVVVQGFAWIPKADRFNGVLPEKLGYAYVAFLNSEVFSELLPAFSNHVSGGQWNLSSKFVAKIPVVDLFTKDIAPETLDLLSECGKSISSGEAVDWNKINDLINDLLSIRKP